MTADRYIIGPDGIPYGPFGAPPYAGANKDWWEDHQNLALTARFMFSQGHSEDDVVYMLEKPWKHDDDYNLAEAELSLPEGGK